MLHTANDIRNASSLDAAADLVRENLQNSNEWLVRGLLAIYARQTNDEQVSHSTKHHNQRGFNGTDATILTSYVEQWKQRHWLSDKQLAKIRQKLPKYAKQLARVARTPAAVVAA